MFNSQKINSDPMPWVNPNDGERRDRQVKWISGPDQYAPRPEFDNNPSPILVAFRDYCTEATPLEFRDAARTWLNLVEGYSVSRSRPEADRIYSELWDSGAVLREHEDHARRVLARLAALA